MWRWHWLGVYRSLGGGWEIRNGYLPVVTPMEVVEGQAPTLAIDPDDMNSDDTDADGEAADIDTDDAEEANKADNDGANQDKDVDEAPLLEAIPVPDDVTSATTNPLL